MITECEMEKWELRADYEAEIGAINHLHKLKKESLEARIGYLTAENIELHDYISGGPTLQ